MNGFIRTLLQKRGEANRLAGGLLKKTITSFMRSPLWEKACLLRRAFSHKTPFLVPHLMQHITQKGRMATVTVLTPPVKKSTNIAQASGASS